MDIAWCNNCHADVLPSLACSGMPCQNCGGREFTILMTGVSSEIEETDSLAESLMIQGLWSEAEDAYRSNSSYEPSEITLRMATLRIRKQCADFAHSFLAEHPDGIAVTSFRQELLNNFDEFVTAWILQNYEGIALVPNGCSYYVIRRNHQ